MNKLLLILTLGLISHNGFSASGQTHNTPTTVDSLLHEASQHRKRGEVHTALALLVEVVALAEKNKDINRLSLAYGGLSDAYLLSRQLNKAMAYAEKGMAIAPQISNPLIYAAILNHYGNSCMAQQRYPEALAAYQKSYQVAEQQNNGVLAVKMLINTAHAHLATGSNQTAASVLEQALSKRAYLKASGEKVFILISLGYLAQRLEVAIDQPSSTLIHSAYTLYTEARGLAEKTHNLRGQSYATGHLGELYTLEQRYKEAEQLFQQALFFAHQGDAPELLARWHWQLGRLLSRQHKANQAESAYRQALTYLTYIQPALLFGHRGNPYFFRDSVGVIYLELMDILLQKVSRTDNSNAYDKALRAVRDVMEHYKTVELKNYFQDDCVTELQAKQPKRIIDQLLTPGTAAVYPIIFADRVVLLLSLADGTIKPVTVAIAADQLKQVVADFRRQLRPSGNIRRLRSHGWQLYDWLIKPLEHTLRAYAVKTLVMVPNGILYTLPFAALYDGEDFLIKRYAFVTTPSLTLTQAQGRLAHYPQVLLTGVSEPVQQFDALPGVVDEINQIEPLFESTRLLNAAFSKRAVESRLKSTAYSAVLFATHAQFHSDPKESFLLTYEGKITLDELSQMTRMNPFRNQPIELLVLSACDTAEGDDRAALGLAGIAVKSGVSSVVASLWAVNDASTAELVPAFFENLKQAHLKKAQALQRAQQKLLANPRYSHPYHWAAFILVGHWL